MIFLKKWFSSALTQILTYMCSHQLSWVTLCSQQVPHTHRSTLSLHTFRSTSASETEYTMTVSVETLFTAYLKVTWYLFVSASVWHLFCIYSFNNQLEHVITVASHRYGISMSLNTSWDWSWWLTARVGGEVKSFSLSTALSHLKRTFKEVRKVGYVLRDF